MTKPSSTFNRAESRVRSLAREELKKRGYHPVHTHPLIIQAIEAETGQKCQGNEIQYIQTWLDSVRAPRKIAPVKFKPLSLSPEWRANVDRARQHQPKLWTPSGIGNGIERRHGFGRGG